MTSLMNEYFTKKVWKHHMKASNNTHNISISFVKDFIQQETIILNQMSIKEISPVNYL